MNQCSVFFKEKKQTKKQGPPNKSSYRVSDLFATDSLFNTDSELVAINFVLTGKCFIAKKPRTFGL